ncbi:MAG: DUF6265 family protein [Pseudomonadota bacterium]
MIRKFFLLVSVCVMVSSAAVVAQETRSIDPQTPSPAASIEQLAWLAGDWRGVDEEGNKAFESWQGPAGGVMAGSFIQMKTDEDGKESADWTEHMVIAPRGDSFGFYMKPFFAEGFDGGFHLYRLVAIEDCTIYFHQVTFQCERENGEIVGLTVIWETTDPLPGESTEPFVYRYVRARSTKIR